MPMRGREAPRRAVLVGFMGAGKSSVGKELARRLGAEFVDVDDRIEAGAGRPIAEIFSLEGEQAFREREREAIRDAVAVPGRVIATGGGAFLDGDNRERLKAYAPVIFLDVSPATALERLAGDTSRPLLSGGDRENAVKELMERRRPAYREADFQVSTENRTADGVAEEVFLLLTRGAKGGTAE
ncbi:MAG: shikimate kinase [Deltaproteobacteria bacterium]|nr:MAG: shikimate kinase [Deltaproteobacteria bacterium]